MDLYPLETRQSYSADVSYTLEEIAASVRQIAKVFFPHFTMVKIANLSFAGKRNPVRCRVLLQRDPAPRHKHS